MTCKSLKEIRLSKKLTQEEVARKADLTYKAYWSIEAGQADPKLSTIVKISSALNISVEELIIVLIQANLANCT